MLPLEPARAADAAAINFTPGPVSFPAHRTRTFPIQAQVRIQNVFALALSPLVNLGELYLRVVAQDS